MTSLFHPVVADATYADGLGTEFVAIFVGPDRKKYAVHKALLVSKSRYFDRALTGGFKEAEENAIYFEEDDPAAIALLIGWLYRGVIPNPAPQSISIDSGFPPSITEITLPLGGTSIPVPHVPELNPPGFIETGLFQSILAHPRYLNYSPEELRLSDYKENRRYGESQQPVLQTRSGLFAAPNPPVGISMPHNPFSPASTTTQTGGGFGSMPLVGGGLGSVPRLSTAESLTIWAGSGPASRVGQGSSLFGNPLAPGSNLFQPSSGSSSGGLFSNLSLGASTQPTPLSSVLFGNPAAATITTHNNQTSGISGTPQAASGTHAVTSIGIFGNLNPASTLPSPSSPPVEHATTGSTISRLSPDGLTRLPTTTDGRLDGPSEPAIQTSITTPNPQLQSSMSLFAQPNQSSLLGFRFSALGSTSTNQPAAESTSVFPTSDLTSYPHSEGSSGTESSRTSSSSQTPVPSNSRTVAGAVNSALESRKEGVRPEASSSTQDFTPLPPASQAAFTCPTQGYPTPVSRIRPNNATENSSQLVFDPLHARTCWPTSPFHSPPTIPIPFTNPAHQLALLNLALFAEKTCWAELYNASMTCYMSGERSLTRPPPLEHIGLIYERTHGESTLRDWAVDSIATFKGEVDMSCYMGLLVEHDGFLEGVLRKLRETSQQSNFQQGGFNGAGLLKYRILDTGDSRFLGKGKGKSA